MDDWKSNIGGGKGHGITAEDVVDLLAGEDDSVEWWTDADARHEVRA